MGDALAKTTMLFVLVLALSLVIERFLEVLKSGYDMLDSRYDWYRGWTRRAERIRDRLERRLRILQFVSPDRAKLFLARFHEMLAVPPVGDNAGAVPVISGDLVRAVYVRVASKVVAIAIGVPLAFALDLDIFTLLKQAAAPEGTCTPGGALAGRNAFDALCSIPLDPWLATLATGVTIGLGSGPVHKIIATIEKKRDERARKELAHV